MYQLGLSVSSMLGRLFSRGVDSAPHSRENGWSSDAQSHTLCKLNQNNCKQNSPWDLMYVGGTRCFEQAMDWCLLVVGEYKLYHSVWELPIMHVVWKIQPTHSCCVDSESMPLKILFNLYFKIELWHLYKSCFPLRRAYLFTFIAESSSSYKKHQLESTTVICMHCY